MADRNIPTLGQSIEWWQAKPNNKPQFERIKDYYQKVFFTERYFTEAIMFQYRWDGVLGMLSFWSTPESCELYKDNCRMAENKDIIVYPYWMKLEGLFTPGAVPFNFSALQQNGVPIGTLEQCMTLIHAPDNIKWRQKYSHLIPGPEQHHKDYLRLMLFQVCTPAFLIEATSGRSSNHAFGLDVYIRVSTPNEKVPAEESHWVLNITQPVYQRENVRQEEWWYYKDWVTEGQCELVSEWLLSDVDFNRYRAARL